jgi:hypothetical protein
VSLRFNESSAMSKRKQHHNFSVLVDLKCTGQVLARPNQIIELTNCKFIIIIYFDCNQMLIKKCIKMTMFCFFDMITESKVYWSRSGEAQNIKNLLILLFLCLKFVDSVFANSLSQTIFGP